MEDDQPNARRGDEGLWVPVPKAHLATGRGPPKVPAESHLRPLGTALGKEEIGLVVEGDHQVAASERLDDLDGDGANEGCVGDGERAQDVERHLSETQGREQAEGHAGGGHDGPARKRAEKTRQPHSGQQADRGGEEESDAGMDTVGIQPKRRRGQREAEGAEQNGQHCPVLRAPERPGSEGEHPQGEGAAAVRSAVRVGEEHPRVRGGECRIRAIGPASAREPKQPVPRACRLESPAGSLTPCAGVLTN